MISRLQIILLTVLCLFLCVFSGSAEASCASQGSGQDKISSVTDAVSDKTSVMETEVTNKLQTASDNFVDATKAAATSATNDTQSLAKILAGFEDAKNTNQLTLEKAKKMYESAVALKPTVQDCVNISGMGSGLESEQTERAALNRMDADSRNDFTNDVKSPYSKGVASALSVQFIEYLQYYCNPSANNGNMPVSGKGVVYTPTVDVPLSDGTVLKAGSSHEFYCGEGRKSISGLNGNFLIDADIRVGDVLFGDKTWPMNDGSVKYGNMIHAAAKQMNRLLNVSPRDPFNPSAFSGGKGIDAFMARRSFEARAAMAESQFNYISAKRLPTAKGSGNWMRDMLAKELSKTTADASQQGMNKFCANAFDSNNKIKQGFEPCGMWLAAKKIPDTASKTELRNYIMMDRFLGTDFMVSNANENSTALLRQQIHLLSLDLIQQREINETIERILGTMAAKYALSVDQTAQASSIGGSK